MPQTLHRRASSSKSVRPAKVLAVTATLAACIALASCERKSESAAPGPNVQTAASPNLPPDLMPPAEFTQMLTAPGGRESSFPDIRWRQPVVTVAFDGGSDALLLLIEQAASEWTASGGGLRLSFRDGTNRFRRWTSADTKPAADIRVSFTGVGYWSALGVLAQRYSARQATLNLAGFPQKLAAYTDGRNPAGWRNSYEHSVVLHEFGHALGLNHEHFHPDCQKDLKLDVAIASLMGPPDRWPLDQAKFNMDAAYYLAEMKRAGVSNPTVSPATDQSSVMLYSFPDTFYRSGAASPCRPQGPLGFATALSAGDRAFYLRTYPAS